MKKRIGLLGALLGVLLLSNAIWAALLIENRSSTGEYAQAECEAAGVALHTLLAMAKTRPRAEIVAAVRSSGARVYRNDPDLVIVGNLMLWFKGENLVSVDRMFGPQECVVSGDT
jgi:hypothetical protein